MNRLLAYLTFALSLALLATGTACTFNVSVLDRELIDVHEEAFETLTVDLASLEPRISESYLTIVGSERTDARAVAQLTGLRSSGTSEDLALAGWGLDLSPGAGTNLDLMVIAPLSSNELWMEEIRVEVPAATDLALNVLAIPVEVSGMTGRVEVTSLSGSMLVTTSGVVELTSSSGAMIVEAQAATLATRSGSMVVDLAEWISVSTVSGSLAGSIGDGGHVETTSGSVDVTLTQPLARDLVITTVSGSIVLTVPAGAPMSLDLSTESGGVAVRLPGLEHDGSEYVGDVAGGGPVLRIETVSGSIHVITED